MKRGSEIRDCNFEWETGIGDFAKWDSRNDTFSRKMGQNCTKRIKL